MIAWKIPEYLKFIGIGILNTAVGLSIIYACMHIGRINPFYSNAIGYSVGLLLGYILNKNWTFQFNKKSKITVLLYVLVVVFAYLVNIGVLYAGINKLNINPYVTQLFGMTAYTLISYMGCKKIVFTSFLKPQENNE